MFNGHVCLLSWLILLHEEPSGAKQLLAPVCNYTQRVVYMNMCLFYFSEVITVFTSSVTSSSRFLFLISNDAPKQPKTQTHK